jgi:hypothetical protein
VRKRPVSYAAAHARPAAAAAAAAGWLAAGLLSGCGAGRLAEDAPAGVALAGAWKLDHAASDDPQKLLARLREEARSRIARRANAPPPTMRSGTRGGGASRTPPEEAPPEEPAADAGRPGAPRPDPLRYSPMAHVLLERLARGDFLTVKQGPGEFVLDYGTSQRNFTPGARSVVSSEGGVGEQTSGWAGREYLIRVRGQSGPDVTERYGLSADGKHLVEKLHIAAAELSAIDLTRVYEPTAGTAPRPLPTSD